jgi:hypothetical protein
VASGKKSGDRAHRGGRATVGRWEVTGAAAFRWEGSSDGVAVPLGWSRPVPGNNALLKGRGGEGARRGGHRMEAERERERERGGLARRGVGAAAARPRRVAA